ncbi:endonuclease I family protein [Streptomyces fungicidicus]|uniref:endonuclease I family protein n=1 Tax=Streptomyces fungicidicus TaxID=68203 RepID=UPI003819E61B
MPVTPMRRHWKSLALATSAVLVGLSVPALTAPPAGAATTAASATTATTATSAYDASYYDGATGKTGTALKDALNTIISDQTKISYSAVWNALKVTDQDPNNSNNVILLYSGISRSKSLNGGDVGDWNREHVWAKSHGDFGTATGPGTDLHHLRPEDVQVNSVRSNKDFDNGGSSFTNSGGSLTDSNSFEPRDAVKGDVARMILYMAVRYEGTDGWPDLEPNDSVTNGSNPYHGRLSVLKQWHEQDPPSAFEKNRNDVIYNSYQHNRNPFIDHPEWVEAIW